MKALFTGVETYNWTTEQFQQALQRMQRLGIDTWMLKIADGMNIWYGGLQKAVQLVKTLDKEIHVIPYGYSYGGTSLTYELTIAKECMLDIGYYLLDCETEWNGHIDYLESTLSRLGTSNYGITSWADPALQQWQGLLQALVHTNVLLLPQVYTQYLAGVWKEQYAQCGIPMEQCIPVYSMQTAELARGTTKFALWEYSEMTDGTIQQATGIDYIEQAMKDCWNSSSQYLKTIPDYTTGIARNWQLYYRKGYYYGPPMGQEYDSVDWQGNSIRVQEFMSGRAEYYPISGKIDWYR